MAEAMLASLLKNRIVATGAVLACDVNGERRDLIRRKLGVAVYAKADAVVDAADVLILAVKPQDLQAALAPVAASVGPHHLVISIAAGKSLAGIEALLPEARVVRVMPNLPSLVGEGMSVFCVGARATERDRVRARSLLAGFGKVLELPEALFDAVTALSGSGPAFFAYVLDGMASAATELGLSREHALLLAAQTMLGTARFLIEEGIEPGDLIKSVASAKGTTAAGLAVLAGSDVAAVLKQTITAAAVRSRELSAC
jgi:pyrroline-5-carboxylate reductase